MRSPSLDVSPWWRGAHLAILWAFAVVQPLLDLLGRNAEFFIARGNGALDVVVFGLALTLVPPVLLLGLEQLVGTLSARAQAVQLREGANEVAVYRIVGFGLKPLAELGEE